MQKRISFPKRISHSHLQRSATILATLVFVISVLTGCVAGFSVPGDSVSEDFNEHYSETHKHWTKQQVIEERGAPAEIFRSRGETYYVYEERGDVSSLIGIPLVVPPFFVPIWVAKEEDVDNALRCLALVFDDEGVLQYHQIKEASRVGFESAIVVPSAQGPGPGISYHRNDTGCAKVLWSESELQSMKLVSKEEEIRSFEVVASDKLAVWAYSVLGNTPEGYIWLCRAGEKDGTESQIQLGNIFYFQSHQSRENLVRSYVWYRLASNADNEFAVARLDILTNMLTPDELSRATHNLSNRIPGSCMSDLRNAGFLQ